MSVCQTRFNLLGYSLLVKECFGARSQDHPATSMCRFVPEAWVLPLKAHHVVLLSLVELRTSPELQGMIASPPQRKLWHLAWPEL